MNTFYIFVYNFYNNIYRRYFNMDINRINSILSNDEKIDVFYQDRPVWIQGVSNNIAKVGFVDNFEEKDIFIKDLYEKKN